MRTRTDFELRKHFVHKGKDMKATSSELSPRIVRERGRVHDQALRYLAVSVKGCQPKRILDVGTGYGTNLRFMANRFGGHSRIWSIDASPWVVREMKRKMRDHRFSEHVIIKKADAEHSSLKSAYFDLVVSLFSLHHLSNPKRGLSEMERVLSPGGKLIIADWTPAAGRRLKLHGQSEMPSPKLVVDRLKQLGFHTQTRLRPYWYCVEVVK